MWRYLTTYWSNSNSNSLVDHEFTIFNLSSTTTTMANSGQLLHSLHPNNNTDTEVVFLEKLLLGAVNAHLQYTLLCTSPSGNGNSADTCSGNNSASIAEVYAKYVHFFTAVQDFTR